MQKSVNFNCAMEKFHNRHHTMLQSFYHLETYDLVVTALIVIYHYLYFAEDTKKKIVILSTLTDHLLTIKLV